ncbi:MAG TPA: ammonium transporter [Euryarchaeota archaeon]|nr:ammonium transporter [Euryarchaeota archaeon]
MLLALASVHADEAVKLNTGNTAWVLAAAALVILMTPAVGLFYGGMVRKKNVVSTITMSMVVLALVSIQWVLIGYPLAFGKDIGGVIGSFSNIGVGLNDVGLRILPSTGIPELAFVIFQGAFAIITPALIIAAFVERIKFSSFIVFILIWTTIVYDPIAHWVWGGGWLASFGAIDFAGGTVVHISSGVSALAIALVIGKRKGFGSTFMEPHNIPMTILGAVLLWFGWFGFNAGSALGANSIAANAFVTTNTATAAAALTWMFISWYHRKPSGLGVASGAVAGLVAITPAAGFVTPLASIIIGIGAGFVCYYAILFREKRGIDESLDAWAVHGMGGTWGALATGIFASVGATGLLMGDVHQFVAQILAVSTSWVYAFVVTFVLAKIIDKTIGLRVPEEDEDVGLDLAQHGEKAYT